MQAKKVILMIMDGWGLGTVPSSDAILKANTPFVDSLYEKYANCVLTTCGEAVGLPDGQMGNSEVGHLNLGAGRIVYQELQRINVAIRNGSFAQNEVLLNAINTAKANNKTLHLMGLISDGGVHSHINHVKAIVDVCKQQGLSNVAIHAFTDGRDTDPKMGLHYITDLQKHLENSVGEIATVIGRYYAMDRDKRWERVQIAYNALVNGEGEATNDILKAIQNNYENNITDEFIKPIINSNVSNDKRLIKSDDVVICFNFRTDRCREITEVLTQQSFPDFQMQPLNLHYTTLTEYDVNFKNINVVFKTDNLVNTIGEVIANNNKKQIRIAETEKYPHVSFFFSGGREKEFDGEKRLMAPSPKVATYDLQPEMSSAKITTLILPEIKAQSADFICLNFANADMVGHTGVWNAVIKSVETVDAEVEKITKVALANGYTVFLTADHGNADYLINADGTPNTAHTTNLVPYFIIDKNETPKLKPGKLGDVAPTILHLMQIEIPTEMTGDLLITD
jgi:2,3-bisphosphoglycerate-independent phosphoglycerate mutase